MTFHDPFPALQIFVPLISLGIIVLCCTSFCKAFQRAREERLERLTQPQVPEGPAIFVIPLSPSENDLHRPPRYSTVDYYSPPPPYNELEMKPESPSQDPPPAYSETFSPPP